MESITVARSTDVAEARRRAVSAAGVPGWGEKEQSTVAIIVTELGTNLVRHGGGGEILIGRQGEGADGGVEVVALDRGPGMADPEACRRDGFSTAGGPGAGLGAVARLSSFVDIYSRPGEGTAVLAHFGGAAAAGAAQGRFVFGGMCLAKPGETVSGDEWRAFADGEIGSIMVADGIGHGEAAAEAARLAGEVFQRHRALAPGLVLARLQEALIGTRGAAVAVARLDLGANLLAYCGIGNISGGIIADGASRGLVSLHGIVGSTPRRPQEFSYPFPRGALAILHSDGLGTNWSLARYPGLAERHPSLVAAVLYRDFARRRDDVTVVVARARGDGA